MSLTLAAVGDNKLDIYGATPTAMFDITFDNSYPAAGYAVVAANFGLSRPIAGIVFIAVNTAGFVRQYQYNNQTAKIMVLMTVGAAGTAAYVDVTPATDLSASKVRALILCQR